MQLSSHTWLGFNRTLPWLCVRGTFIGCIRLLGYLLLGGDLPPAAAR